MSSSACSGAAAEDSKQQQSEGRSGMVTQAAASAATAVGVTSTCSSDGDAPASPSEPMMGEGAAAGEQQPQQQQQLEPALRAAKCNAAVELAGWGQAVGKQVCKWGSAAEATVNGKRLHPQHHASAGLATTASSTHAPHGSPRAGGGARSGGGCKRPLPTSSSSSSLEDAETENLAPQEFLHRILRERGYETAPVPANKQAFFQPPTPKQIQDYDLALINAVKAADLASLEQLASDGRQMDACNRHGESIVHMSCRRGHAETLRFLLTHGGRVHMCDDLGRTPLHDACWAKTPVFDCIAAIMDQDPSLIRVVDCRGASPLAYIRQEHWPMWRRFFDSKKDTYWKPLRAGETDPASASASPSLASSASSASLASEGEGMDVSTGSGDCSGSGAAEGQQQDAKQLQDEEGQMPAKRLRSSTRLAAAGMSPSRSGHQQ